MINFLKILILIKISIQKKNTSIHDEEINLTSDIRKVIIEAYKFDYQLYNSI